MCTDQCQIGPHFWKWSSFALFGMRSATVAFHPIGFVFPPKQILCVTAGVGNLGLSTSPIWCNGLCIYNMILLLWHYEALMTCLVFLLVSYHFPDCCWTFQMPGIRRERWYALGDFGVWKPDQNRLKSQRYGPMELKLFPYLSMNLCPPVLEPSQPDEVSKIKPPYYRVWSLRRKGHRSPYDKFWSGNEVGWCCWSP